MPAHDNSFTSEDRDLLITLREGLAALKSTVDELRDEHNKADYVPMTDFKELKTSVEQLKQFRWWIAGAAGAAGVAAHFIFHL